MKPIRAEIILRAAGKVLLAFSIIELYFALSSMGLPFEIFVAKSLQNWLLFSVCLTLSLFTDIASTHPEVRAYFTHIEKPQKQAKLKHGFTEEDAMAALLKKHPELAAALQQAQAAPQPAPAAQATSTTPEKPQESPEAAPKPQTIAKPKKNQRLPL